MPVHPTHPPPALANVRKLAWGSDEANVLAKEPAHWFHLGLTIVDGMDTLLVAGLDSEFREVRCVQWPH